MADINNNSDSIKKNCKICNVKSKFKLCEDIEKELITKTETRKGNQDVMQYEEKTSENDTYIFSEIKMSIDDTSPKKTKSKKSKIQPEIETFKDLLIQLLRNVKNIIDGHENSLTECIRKNEEMIKILQSKEERIKQLEKQNSCLQRGLKEMCRRLDLVELSARRANTELSSLQLGQQLNVDFSTPPRLYNADFQVRDHKMSGGVWLYNNRDNNSNVDSGLAASTEYFSTESPGKSTTITGFQMAPGGERRKSTTEPTPKDTVDDLQRRLDNLRGFK